MIDRAELARLLADHLPRQRWFARASSGDAVDVTVVSLTTLREPWPGLVHALVDAEGARWQVFVGLRPVRDAAGVVKGKPDAVIGEIDTDGGPALAYDATIDPEQACTLLEQVAGDLRATRARQLVADQSNTSVVLDERVMMKLFRRMPAESESGRANPEVEVGVALAEAGFRSVPTQLGAWRRDGVDLAVAQEYLVGGVDAFHLALTSLHDLFEAGGAPEAAGGDFGPDAHRIGGVTAEMHLALARAFGSAPGDSGRWADEMLAQLDRAPDAPPTLRSFDVGAVRQRYEALRDPDLAASSGAQLRVHGDLHLGQVLRTDSGWYVLDFEGEPARPLAERTRPSSPLRDVAGMLRSFQYAAAVAQREYGYGDDAGATACGGAWGARNVEAFLSGYLGVEGIEAMLPPSASDRHVVLDAFLLDKAVYEVGYELAHRPGWVDIPLTAVRRLLAAPSLP